MKLLLPAGYVTVFYLEDCKPKKGFVPCDGRKINKKDHPRYFEECEIEEDETNIPNIPPITKEEAMHHPLFEDKIKRHPESLLSFPEKISFYISLDDIYS